MCNDLNSCVCVQPESQIFKDAKRLEEFFDNALLKWLPEYAYWCGEGTPPHKRARIDWTAPRVAPHPHPHTTYLPTRNILLICGHTHTHECARSDILYVYLIPDNKHSLEYSVRTGNNRDMEIVVYVMHFCGRSRNEWRRFDGFRDYERI